MNEPIGDILDAYRDGTLSKELAIAQIARLVMRYAPPRALPCQACLRRRQMEG